MNFIVEDGTGLPNATSYVDVAFADSYFENLGGEDWAKLQEEEKQIALNVGSSYIDLRFGSRLQGYPLKQTQALALPMGGISDRYGKPVLGIPLAWKRAVCEYALLSRKGPLMDGQQSLQGAMKKKMVKVGPITTDYEYSVTQQTSTFKAYPQADALVTAFFGLGTFGAGRVIRG
ncbi:MAG: DnaT-like ssDNA-binding protein [Aeromonas veronii]